MNTNKKNTTSRMGRATQQAGVTPSAANQRLAAARQHARRTLKADRSDTAARVTMILTNFDADDETREVVRQAVADLADLTLIDATHPTVIRESMPTMIAAIESDETVLGEETAEQAHKRLLDLLDRAERGEVLSATTTAKEPEGLELWVENSRPHLSEREAEIWEAVEKIVEHSHQNQTLLNWLDMLICLLSGEADFHIRWRLGVLALIRSATFQPGGKELIKEFFKIMRDVRQRSCDKAKAKKRPAASKRRTTIKR